MSSPTEEEIDNIERVMSNHLILENIGKHLPIKYLLNCRLVSTFWYRTFSKYAAVAFPNDRSFMEFIKYHQESKEKKSPYNFIHLKELYNLDIEKFHELSNGLALVKSLKISFVRINGIELGTILNSCLHTLENISICFNHFVEEKSRIFESEEKSFNLPKLLNLELNFNRVSWKHNQIIDDLLLATCSPNLQSFKLKFWESQIPQLSYILDLFILKDRFSLLNLKNFRVSLPNLNDVDICEKLIEFTQKFRVRRIEIITDTIITKLNSEELSDFLNLMAFYFKNKSIKMKKTSQSQGNFKDLQLPTVTRFKNNDDKLIFDLKTFIPMNKILFHFPRLRELQFREFETNIISLLDLNNCEPSKNTKELSYISTADSSHEQICDISEKLIKTFPNLTKLEIHSTLRLDLIFKHLNKLKVFLYNGTATDYEIIGIPKAKIEEYKEWDSQLKLKEASSLDPHILQEFETRFFKDCVGIQLLTDLKEFYCSLASLKINSLIFGIRYLTNLEILNIRNIEANSFWIFLEDNFLPKLETLYPNEDINNVSNEILKAIKTKRPFLSLSFLYENNDAGNDYKED